MSAEEHKAIVRRFVEEVQNRGDLAALDELCAPDFVNHSAPPGVPPTREGLAQLAIEEMLAEGDRVVTRKTFRGTHRGELMGLPATGRRVEIGLIDIVRLDGGQVVEHWNAVDNLGMLQQLGAIPAPGEGGS